MELTETRLSVQAPRLPKSASLPLLGALPLLAPRPFAYLKEAWQTKGDIFKLDLGLIDAVVLSHPRHAQYVLRDNARNFRKGGAMWASVRSMFGNGLVVSEGDYWLRQRRMMQPHFHRKYIAGLMELMLTAIDEQMDTWPEAADSFNSLQAMNQITMDVIVRTMFGTELDETDFRRLSEAMGYAMDYLLAGMLQYQLPDWLPFPGKRRYQESLRTFDEIVYGVIRRQRENPTGTSLLTMLLNVEDAETGERMTDEQLRDEVATVFVAGYETTAIAMAWAADFLARDEALQDRLVAEIDAATGDGEKPSLMTLRELGLVQRTFKEALRIRPSAWFLPRSVVEDDEIDGYPLPAGTQVAILIYHMHHHPDHWDQPDRFDPDRFLGEANKQRHPFAWVPFGSGQRMCIGRDFSMMEGQLILTRLLQRYRLKPVGEQPAKPQLSSTLRPKGGVTVQLVPR